MKKKPSLRTKRISAKKQARQNARMIIKSLKVETKELEARDRGMTRSKCISQTSIGTFSTKFLIKTLKALLEASK